MIDHLAKSNVGISNRNLVHTSCQHIFDHIMLWYVEKRSHLESFRFLISGTEHITENGIIQR